MQWRDQGIVLSCRKFMENSAIVKFFTLEHGIHTALVKYANSKNNRSIYDVSNWLSINWKARLINQLGTVKAEVIHNFAVELILDRRKLYVIKSITNLLQLTLPEHEPYHELYEDTINIIQLIINKPDMAIEYYAIFEFILLKYIGFAIDISKCTVSGQKDNLIYVSPKSAKAVSQSVGQKYANKLLRLPKFLLEYEHSNHINKSDNNDLKNALDLTGYFLNKNILMVNNLKEPETRKRIMSMISKPKIEN